MRYEYFNKNSKVLSEEHQRIIRDFSIRPKEAARLTGVAAERISWLRHKMIYGGSYPSQSSREYYKANSALYQSPDGKKRRWTEDEDRLVMNTEKRDEELAEELQRSIIAIQTRRTRLRRWLNEGLDYNRLTDKPVLNYEAREAYRYNKKFNVEEVERAKAYITENRNSKTRVEMAKELGISLSTLANIIDKMAADGEYHKRKWEKRERINKYEQNR